MRVTLRFFASLRNFLPKSGAEGYPAEIPDGSTVSDVIARYGIPPEKPKIILVNGRHAGAGTVLSDGDSLSLFPPVAGG